MCVYVYICDSFPMCNHAPQAILATSQKATSLIQHSARGSSADLLSLFVHLLRWIHMSSAVRDHSALNALSVAFLFRTCCAVCDPQTSSSSIIGSYLSLVGLSDAPLSIAFLSAQQSAKKPTNISAVMFYRALMTAMPHVCFVQTDSAFSVVLPGLLSFSW
jgi:hypothetical protein